MRAKTDIVEEILAKTDIVELVRGYVPLLEKGGGYWACCPFHHEKTPSFRIDRGKQLYYCFGTCREGGNAITFIKKIESVDGSDAIRILAKKAGVELPENFAQFKEKSEGEKAELGKKKERLFSLMRTAARFYHNNLSAPEGEKFSRYLQNRGIGGALIKKFGLGASLDGKSLIEHLTKEDYKLDELKDANVAQINERGAYDPFYDRLIIPIINQFGEVCAFGGRTLAKDPDFAKYRNSAATILFDKSKTLFVLNLLQARKKKQQPIEYIILCEGYMDVIALHAAGFDTAVASMGTALTYNQAKQLKNFCAKVYISFDGDTAGQKNALAGLDILSSAGLTVRVVELPNGLDPDDVVKNGGQAAYKNLLDNAVTLVEFKIKKLAEKYDLKDIEQKARFTSECIKVIKAEDNETLQETYFIRLQKLTGYTLEVIRRQADKTIDLSLSNAPIEAQERDKQDRAMLAQKFVLASLAAAKPYVDYKEDFERLLQGDSAKAIAHFFIANRREKSQSVDGFLYNLLGEDNHKYLDEILHYKFILGDDSKKYADCIYSLKKSFLQKEKARLEQAYKTTKDVQILQEIQDILEQIQQLRTCMHES